MFNVNDGFGLLDRHLTPNQLKLTSWNCFYFEQRTQTDLCVSLAHSITRQHLEKPISQLIESLHLYRFILYHLEGAYDFLALKINTRDPALLHVALNFVLSTPIFRVYIEKNEL